MSPARSAGRQRRYSDEDLRRFVLLAEATSSGRSIGTIATLPTSELEQLVARDRAEGAVPTAPNRTGGAIAIALGHIKALDAFSLDSFLRRAIADNGLPWFIEEFVPSLMHAVGDGWAARELTIAQEHLASAATRAVIVTAAHDLRTSSNAPRVLVATPSGDLHAVGAALAMAAATLENWRVIYLGADVPALEIANSVTASGARAVALSAVYTDDAKKFVDELAELRAALPLSIPIYVGGAAAIAHAGTIRAPGVHICARLADLRRALSSHLALHPPSADSN